MFAVSFQAILEKALADYSKQIGIELDKHPFANELRGHDSPDDILKLLEDKAKSFKVYRDGNCKLITWLKPVVQVISTLSGVLGEAVSLMSRMRSIASTFFTIRLPVAFQSSKTNLCRCGCSNHGTYPVIFLPKFFLICTPHRQPTVSAQAMMPWLTCLNVSGTSSNAFESIPISR